ncbi:MAG: hypothetical protein MZU95_00445 [Desulfomicrobium escambiense]|nr:hypothetical protein [Desulfomicrobium escambiense]
MARLKARPVTNYCLDCKTRMEVPRKVSRKRWHGRKQ